MTSSSDIDSAKERKYDVAAYIWPAYTGTEPRTRIFWPEGMGEWETVREMRPRFEGHQWPRKPLWGYCDEANPDVMRMQIDAAADHGVNVFIYDWYSILCRFCCESILIKCRIRIDTSEVGCPT